VSRNQDKSERNKHGSSNMVLNDSEIWNDHTVVTWNFEGIDVICLLGLGKEGEYHVDIAQLSDDLLYKDIPMTFYVNNEHVMDGEQCFIAWDHNGVDVKYLPCAFDGVYVLDLKNMPKDLLYKDILEELHVYHTHDYFNTI
jgi:hypothetical protein